MNISICLKRNPVINILAINDKQSYEKLVSLVEFKSITDNHHKHICHLFLHYIMRESEKLTSYQNILQHASILTSFKNMNDHDAVFFQS